MDHHQYRDAAIEAKDVDERRLPFSRISAQRADAPLTAWQERAHVTY